MATFSICRDFNDGDRVCFAAQPNGVVTAKIFDPLDSSQFFRRSSLGFKRGYRYESTLFEDRCLDFKDSILQTDRCTFSDEFYYSTPGRFFIKSGGSRMLMFYVDDKKNAVRVTSGTRVKTNVRYFISQNATYSEWSDWSACDCDEQKTTRTRDLITQAMYGGSEESTVEQESCVCELIVDPVPEVTDVITEPTTTTATPTTTTTTTTAAPTTATPTTTTAIPTTTATPTTTTTSTTSTTATPTTDDDTADVVPEPTSKPANNVPGLKDVISGLLSASSSGTVKASVVLGVYIIGVLF